MILGKNLIVALDGVAIAGANEQFYQLRDTINPHLYYVEATTTDGHLRTSCVQLFEQFTPSVTQHPAKSNQLVLHRGHLYIKTEDAMYDILGNKYEEFLR